MSQAIFAKIADEAASGGRGGRFVQGAGKLAITKFVARSGFKGETVILHTRILESRATKPGTEPNPPGAAVDYVQTLDKLGAGGRVKAIVLAIIGARGDEVSDADALVCATKVCGLDEKTAQGFLAEQVAKTKATYKCGDDEARYIVVAGLLTDSAQPARGVVLGYDAYETQTQKGQSITGLSLTHTGERVNLD